MRRVLLSIAIGLMFVIGYLRVGLTLYSIGILPKFASNALAIPMFLPDAILRISVARSDLQDFDSKHAMLRGLYEVFANAAIYSIAAYLIWSLTVRTKRKPATVSAEPPLQPEF